MVQLDEIQSDIAIYTEDKKKIQKYQAHQDMDTQYYRQYYLMAIRAIKVYLKPALLFQFQIEQGRVKTRFICCPWTIEDISLRSIDTPRSKRKLLRNEKTPFQTVAIKTSASNGSISLYLCSSYNSKFWIFPRIKFWHQFSPVV